MVHHTNCPLCKESGIRPFITCKDNLVSGEEFTLFRCQSCSFTFTQDYPDEALIGKYYESSEYISHSDSNKSLIDKIYQVVRRHMLNRKRHMVEKACNLKSGYLLDIGSGTGHFLNTMKKAGWKTIGIEPNEKAKDYALSHFGLDIKTPENIGSLDGETFDCITLWHVLEHFHNPDKYFEHIKRILKPAGKVIVALPNCESADALHYNENWAAYDVPRHLWHFSPSTFKQFAERNGFSIQSINPLRFDVFYISMLSEENRKSKLASIQGITKGMWFSFFSLFNAGKHSSLVYVLRISGA